MTFVNKTKSMRWIFPAALVAAMLLWTVGCKDNKTCCLKDKAGKHTCKAQSGVAPATENNIIAGRVVKTMDVPEYTYVLLNTGADTVWAAGPRVSVSVGDTVEITNGLLMKQYQSKTLNQTFDSIYFAGALNKKGTSAFAGKSACPTMANPSAGVVSPHGVNGRIPNGQVSVTDFSGIQKPLFGKTVAELFAQKNNLAGKSVTLRARVVKASYNILGKTWLHLRDGTGADGANDLTVTTDASVQIDKIVLVKGILTKDKNIGSGYNFPLIIENAQVIVEK